MKIHRLNYIGSKFQLLEWLETNIKATTGWTSFAGKRIGDLFAGTGIVSHHFRLQGALTITNDAELYSSIISKAFATSVYSSASETFIADCTKEIADKKHLTEPGYIQTHYSPHPPCERMFFTIENAQRIDYIRSRLETAKASLDPSDYTFLLASLLLSADAVSNVPAVYGCYLKKFKTKAEKLLTLLPIHDNKVAALDGSLAFHSDVLSLPDIPRMDAVYLDPPYNERQYSKNYFPLNMIAKTPAEQEAEPDLKGKTGIPQTCFMSPFCKKDKVQAAFEKLIGSLKAEWIFTSYNSESLIKKDAMVTLMKKFGELTVIERDYKRFKAYEYNEDKKIVEYLFCLRQPQYSPE